MFILSRIISLLKKFYPEFCRKINLHHKKSVTVLSLILVPVVSSGSLVALNQSSNVVTHVETALNVFFDDQNKEFVTTKGTVGEALISEGINLEEFDVTEPDRESKLTGGELKVLVKRWLPVLVVDNGVSTSYRSGHEDPLKILNQLNIKVYPEDIITFELVTDFLTEKIVGPKIIIERAPVIFINVDGETLEFRSWTKTVGEVLKEKEVSLGEKDRIEPPKESLVTSGTTVTITRVKEVETTVKETIHFYTEYRNDVNTYVGNSWVETEGSNGEKEVTYKITYENGVEATRMVLTEKILTSVINKIVIKGVKPYDSSGLWDIIVAAAAKYGVDPNRMYQVMICESGGNPNRVSYNGMYHGLFQYLPSTWHGASAAAGWAGANIYDPTAQIYVTAWKVSVSGWSGWGCS